MSQSINILSDKFLSKYKTKQPDWGYNGLGFVVFKRTYARLKPDGKTEDWWETVARCVEGAQKIGAEYTREEAESLYDKVFNLKCNFAGRMLWQLGTSTVDRFGANSLLNCWMVSMNEPRAFEFLFENLMLGGGVGFSIRKEDVHELPRIREGVRITALTTKDADFIVPDSREGWVKLLHQVLQAYFVTGKSFSFSTILVRGAGEKISGFGGTASGPSILVDGMTKIATILMSREGKKLRSIDVLDVCNIIGSVVVAGNVRRSAQIALGDPDDHYFIRAKNWSLGNVPNWRAMSNNTIYADSYSHVSNDLWDNGFSVNPETGFAKGEPYGFFNLPLSQKWGRIKDGPMKDSTLYAGPKDNCVGTNPCVTGDTWVQTSEGARQVNDLIGKPFEAIHHGKAYQTVSKGFWHSGRKKVVKVKTHRGLTLTLTPNHKLLQDFDVEQHWTEVGDLKVGDKLVLQQHESHVWGDPNETEKGWLLGNLVGDGTFTTDTAILTYWGESKREMLAYAGELIKTTVGGRKDIGTAENDDHDRMCLGSRSLKDLAESHGIRQNDKYDLTLVEQTSSSFHEGFLQGLFDADGSIQGNQEKGVSVRLSSVSLPLLRSAQRMLNRLGILSVIYEERSAAGMKPLPDGRGGIKDYHCQTMHELVIARDNVIRYADRIGFEEPAKQARLLDTIASYKRAPYRDRYVDAIVSIEDAGEADVYDVTVDQVHAFDANGFVSHNCAEISLASYECCNLSELYLNNIESQEELIECATLLYKTQKAICALPFLHEETNEIVHKNMRIGLGVTGVCQSLDKVKWLDKCYRELRKLDKEWSKKRGWPQSVKLTTIKPSGTLSLLAGATPGVHPAFSQHYIRRVRMGSGDSLVKICRDLGYHVEYVLGFDGKEDHTTVVVEFPCESGANAILTKDMSALKQLELVKQLQTEWADNAVSVTVYYKPEELPEIKKWLADNYEKNIKSVSFLLFSQHGFRQAPYEEISKERYDQLRAGVKPLSTVQANITGEILDTGECVSGICPIR